MQKPPEIHLIYFVEIPLEEGFLVLEKEKHQRLVKGKEVSKCAGQALFSNLKNGQISCWQCGCVASSWIVMSAKAESQFKKPVLNLFARRNGDVVLMTRDHIIPKSVGGVDANENLRPACSVCNGERGNELTPDELEFAKNHPELISEERQLVGLQNLKKMLKLEPNLEKQWALKQPFIKMNIIKE